MTPCSATEPQQVYPTAGPYPALCRDGGARVRIFQADTGLVTGAAETFPWLAGVLRRSRPAGRDRPGSTIGPTGDTGRSSRASCGAWPRKRNPRREHLRHRGQRAGIGGRDEAPCGVRLRLRDRPHNGLVPYPEEPPAAGPGSAGWSCFGRTRVSSASQRRATTTPSGRPGRAHSLTCSPSGRSRPTGVTVRTSAITGAGSTCTRQARTSSTPSAAVRTPARSRLMSGR